MADDSDEAMQDIGHGIKSAEELEAEGWAAFDPAIAEDPTAISKPKPRVIRDLLKMPVSTRRKPDMADDLADLSTSGATFFIDLDVCFDVSHKPKYIQSQNTHYFVEGRDATTIKNLFSTLWLENHEWFTHEGYSLRRVQQAQRMEIVLRINEGKVLTSTQRWTNKGYFNGQEQCGIWKDFIEAAERWGKLEALDQLKWLEKRERMMRMARAKDDLGNYYGQTGNCWRPGKQSVCARVDVQIVLCFD